MILHVNAKAGREIDWAIDEIAHGNAKQALRRLCMLRGREVPAIWRPKKRAVKVPDMAPFVIAPIAEQPGAEWTVTPQPKPPKRLVSRKALEVYRATHPHCEVIGCPADPCPEPHHLVSRKMGGSDVESNLLSVCADHHREWHRGPATWAQRYIHQLTAEARSKVMRALRYTS